MSNSAITMTLLSAVSMPVLAFWVERVLESQVWYMRNPGLIGALAPSWFLMPVLFLAQLMIVVVGWKSLGPRSRAIAVILVLAPIPALLLPLALVFSFQPL
jgi:hypothetical protein